MFSYPFITVRNADTKETIAVPLDKILWVTAQEYDGPDNVTVTVEVPGKTHVIEGRMGAAFPNLFRKVEWIRTRTMEDVLKGM